MTRSPSNTAIVVATLVVVFGLFAFMGKQKMPTPAARITNAYDVSETYVKRELGRPGRAKFSQLGLDPAAESHEIAGENFSTTGSVDAANGAGQPTTRPWHCVVHFEGRDDQEHDKWKLIYMHVDDFTFGTEPKEGL
jgi:hypothetical protein